jgi:hypothetical protein
VHLCVKVITYFVCMTTLSLFRVLLLRWGMTDKLQIQKYCEGSCRDVIDYVYLFTNVELRNIIHVCCKAKNVFQKRYLCRTKADSYPSEHYLNFLKSKFDDIVFHLFFIIVYQTFPTPISVSFSRSLLLFRPWGLHISHCFRACYMSRPACP